MSKKLSRIGIFGGSFDPPHLGHLVIAEVSRLVLKLDLVFFVPAYRPPHKAGDHPATAQQRLAMTKLSVRGNPALRVSDSELRRKGVSYTVDTIRQFRKRYPSAELFLILGGDSLSQFHQWKEPEAILKETTLVVYRRPGSFRRPRTVPARKIVNLRGPIMRVSSTDIRNMTRDGEDLRFLVRENVRRYIKRRHLYAGK